MPRVYAQLRGALARDTVTTGEVARIVAADAVIAAKVLQLVNSAFFRLARRITNIEQAVNYLGFVAIRNHYLSDDLSAKLYDVIKKFFAQPDPVKQQYEIPGLAGQRGYIGKGKEHAKGRNTGDLKEFYHVGQTVVGDDPI